MNLNLIFEYTVNYTFVIIMYECFKQLFKKLFTANDMKNLNKKITELRHDSKHWDGCYCLSCRAKRGEVKNE